MKQIIAFDIGTTGTKVALCDRSGKILASGYAGYKTSYYPGGGVEQNPDDWWKAVQQGVSCIRPYINSTLLCAIILGGQMQDLILLKDDKILHPAILYSDARAGVEIKEACSIIGKDRLTSVTGNVQDASSLLARLLWLQKNKPKIYREAETILFGAHDYIAFRMTGSKNTDYTTASTTGLLNISQNKWAIEFLKETGIREDWLPSLVRADNIDGVLSENAASFLGIPKDNKGISVFHGSGDVGSAGIGAGAGEPGSSYCYIGTSGWVAASTHAAPRNIQKASVLKKSVQEASVQESGAQKTSVLKTNSKGIIADPETGIYNLRHPEPSRFIQVGPMMLAGGNLQWVLKEISAFYCAESEKKERKEGKEGNGKKSGCKKREENEKAEKEGYSYINKAAMKVKAGSEGVLFLPYLAGERSPFKDSDVRGAFIGISRETKRACLYRAVLEGVAFAMRSIREAMACDFVYEKPLILVGGGAKSALWPQIFSDIFGLEVIVLENSEDVGLIGSAIICGKALGWFSSYSLSGNVQKVSRRYFPDENRRKRYNKLYSIFKGMYPVLKASYFALAEYRKIDENSGNEL